jgi:nitroreductase
MVKMYMDAIDAILSRRSIRRFKEEPLPDLVVHELLRAAMSAPSAGNEQPWHFLIIKNRQTLQSISEIHPHSRMLQEAPVAILICGDMELEKHKGFWVQDCSAATENLLIAARDKGLGAVWLGVYPREDRVGGLKKLLDIPNSVIPFALVPLGYPAEDKPKEDRYNIDRIHLEKW